MKLRIRQTTLLVMLNFLSITMSPADKLIPYSIQGQMAFECESLTLYCSIYVSLGKIWSIFPGHQELLGQYFEFYDVLDKHDKYEANVLL